MQTIKYIFQKDQRNIKSFRDGNISFEEFKKKAREISSEFFNLYKENGFPFKNRYSLEEYKNGIILTLHQPVDRMEEIYRDLKIKSPEQVEKKDLAYIEDKIRVNKKEKQLYGTQYKIKDGIIRFLPIENEREVDKKRASMGLESIAKYKRKIEGKS